MNELFNEDIVMPRLQKARKHIVSRDTTPFLGSVFSNHSKQYFSNVPDDQNHEWAPVNMRPPRLGSWRYWDSASRMMPESLNF